MIDVAVTQMVDCDLANCTTDLAKSFYCCGNVRLRVEAWRGSGKGWYLLWNVTGFKPFWLASRKQYPADILRKRVRNAATARVPRKSCLCMALRATQPYSMETVVAIGTHEVEAFCVAAMAIELKEGCVHAKATDHCLRPKTGLLGPFFHISSCISNICQE